MFYICLYLVGCSEQCVEQEDLNVSSWDEERLFVQPSFGSGIVRKGIYLMGVFLDGSERWLVV